ncbi:hypothetical protein NG796_14925, partial [Laspinema sp. A4]|uniref:hypothetical protein n=1 Tax=Laspinema sp. D2d TaxID=2953686 RepID=UPI0021BA405B
MTKKIDLKHQEDRMTFNFWIKGLNVSAVAGTTLGLLMPVLPVDISKNSKTLPEKDSKLIGYFSSALI